MGRIKCPNCGSTALPELVWEDRDGYSTEHEMEYVCGGCGCHFEVIFEVKEVKILKEKG